MRIFDAIDRFDGPKQIVLMFGDVDCSDHIVSMDDQTAAIEDSVNRLRAFASELRSRPGVTSVSICGVLPRTSVFEMNGKGAQQINGAIIEWNARLNPDIDLFTPFAGADGFMIPNLSHNSTDIGERHLSVKAAEFLWQQIESKPL